MNEAMNFTGDFENDVGIEIGNISIKLDLFRSRSLLIMLNALYENYNQTLLNRFAIDQVYSAVTMPVWQNPFV